MPTVLNSHLNDLFNGFDNKKWFPGKIIMISDRQIILKNDYQN